MLSKLHLSEAREFHIIHSWSLTLSRYGIYPLTAFSARQPPTPRPRAISPETAESIKSASPEPLDIESRKVVNMICSVKPIENCSELLVSLQHWVRASERRWLIHFSCLLILDDNTITNGWQDESTAYVSDITRRYCNSLIAWARAFGFY